MLRPRRPPAVRRTSPGASSVSDDFVLVCIYCGRTLGHTGRWQTAPRPTVDGDHISHGLCPRCAALQFPEFFHE